MSINSKNARLQRPDDRVARLQVMDEPDVTAALATRRTRRRGRAALLVLLAAARAFGSSLARCAFCSPPGAAGAGVRV